MSPNQTQTTIQTSTPAAPLPRAIVFLTAPAAADIPGPSGQPACLLPLGSASFAVRVMQACVEAGLRDIDLVASDSPELLRRELGDGERFGLRLRWHLVKDASTPYGVLHTLGLQPGQRVLIGHGHRWVAPRVVSALVQADRVAVRTGEQVAWAGWVSLDALFIHAISPHADEAALAEVAVGLQARQCVMVRPRELAQAGSASELLRAQELVLRDPVGEGIPAAWLRQPWGAMSPEAQVHPEVDIRGPVLIGPGCRVERGAVLGPDTVLSRQVLVCDGAVVRDTLVLPNTYVGPGVTLDHALARGNSVQHLAHGVRTTLPATDAVLAPLVDVAAARDPFRPLGTLTGRLLAATLVAAGAVPALGLHLLQRLRGQTRPWRLLDAITGREDDGRLRQTPMRMPHAARGIDRWVGRYGALLDVAQGRRQWFGVRPRDAAQWYALGRDWQRLFADAPVGFFHAPAWMERGSRADGEALAVADAWLAAQPNLAQRLRLLAGLVSLRRVMA